MKKSPLAIALLVLGSFIFWHSASVVSSASATEDVDWYGDISLPIIDEESVPTVADSPITIQANCAQTVWCSQNDIDFTWIIEESLRDLVKEYQWSLDTQIPRTRQLKTIGLDPALHFEDIASGVYFLYVDAILTEGDDIAEQVYRIKIDTEAPLAFEPETQDTVIELNQKTHIRFHAEDTHSGIDHYEISVDRGEWAEKQSPLVIGGSELGVYEIAIKAIDRSGNETSAQTLIEVVKKLPTPVGATDQNTPGSSVRNSLERALIPAVIIVIGVFILALILLVKKRKAQERFAEKNV
ncbi:MAG TPA: hypothetical protein VJA22_01605 [Patescibacteria group bacterium]|nr:hypothetical protein [Patescibacteria group bacterium]